jgi:beta-glucosidase
MKMKSTLTGLTLFLLGSIAYGFTQTKGAPPITKEVSPYENQITQQMSKMTLDEKIGQMAQFAIDVLLKTQNNVPVEPIALDTNKVNYFLGKLKAGSILNVPAGVAQTPELWHTIIAQMQKAAIKATGIPLIYGIDAIHGGTYSLGATLFPQEVAMGATFNRNLVYQGAQITAYETRASDIPWNFSPVLDMGRMPLWPRMWETYGEDTYLNAQMGVACVEGYQGKDRNHIGMDHVAACLKHYVGYGVPVSGQDRTPAMIPQIELRERHLKPFEEAVKAGALSVMVNSSIVNDLPMHANHYLITDVLKGELHFDGVVVTDWQDINNLYVRDHIASSNKDAIRLAINAGIDMAMIPYDPAFCSELKSLVLEKKVSMARIDDAVRRILRLKYRLGLFNHPDWSLSAYTQYASAAHQKVAEQAADESITLLKNVDQLLPLSTKMKILVTGPNANSMRTLNGGWTISWQGDKADAYLPDGVTILKAIQQKVGASNVVYEPGVTYNMNGSYDAENTPDIAKAVEAAKNVDVIVACVGENSYAETPGNLDDLQLSQNQQDLVAALAKTGKPIVLVLNEGRPRVFSAIEPYTKAVIDIYLPGSEGGVALADVLFGDVNPSGRLPFTYPKYTNLLTTYDYKPCENRATMNGTYFYAANNTVQYSFGTGLSYTTFEYSDLRVNKTHFMPNDELVFTVNVKNTGKVAGKTSVLLFSSEEVASITPDNRRLRAFEKIELAPGETKTVTLKVKASDLAFIGMDNKWHLEKGAFDIHVGSQAVKIFADATKIWPNYIKTDLPM